MNDLKVKELAISPFFRGETAANLVIIFKVAKLNLFFWRNIINQQLKDCSHGAKSTNQAVLIRAFEIKLKLLLFASLFFFEFNELFFNSLDSICN